MATTKNKIAEQIQRIYARFIDKDNPSDVIDKREVIVLIEQAINSLLQVQVSESFNVGLYEVPLCNLIQYTASVTADAPNSRAYIQLPAIPLNLPMNMGIWSIAASGSAVTPYIPIPSQDVLVFGTITSGTNLSYLEGQVGYYQQGTRVYFTKDITTVANGSVTSVVVNLFVTDFSQLTGTELLPISPEIESLVIASVLQTISNGKISQAEIAAKQNE